MITRDPRLAPRVGDELRHGSIRYLVLEVVDDFVTQEMTNGLYAYKETAHIDDWRAWARHFYDDDVTPSTA